MVRRVPLLALAVTVSMASTAAAQVKFEYKFPEGSAAKSKSNLKIKQTLTIGDMNLETQVDAESLISSKVGKRGADGTLPLSRKTNSIKVHVEAAGQTF